MEEKYLNHKIFKELEAYMEFYKDLSFHIMNWHTQGTHRIINLDTYAYSSIQGTLESINDVLVKGRISDSYSLLRKYYDSTVINIYANLFLSDNYSIDNFIVKEIDNWIMAKDKLPEYRIMIRYIRESEKLAEITTLLKRDKTYETIRKRCNDYTHYNYFRIVLLNDNNLFLKDRLKILDRFSEDIRALFIKHLAYLFYLNDHYMMAEDYMDYMEVGMQPEPEMEFWVANFIKEIFNDVVMPLRPDLVEAIRKKTNMNLA